MIEFTMNGVVFRRYDHLYAVSRCGLALRQMQPFTPWRRKDGYLTLGRQRLMHRVVASVWCERREGTTYVHHKNGDKADNRADNLEWVSPREHLTERHDVARNGKYIRSEETRMKLAAVRKGKRDSEETRAKKAAILDAVRVKRRPIEFQGTLYSSVSAAARAADMPLSTFRLRFLR